MSQETQLNVIVANKSIAQPDNGQSDFNFLAKIRDFQLTRLSATVEVKKQQQNQNDFIIK